MPGGMAGMTDMAGSWQLVWVTVGMGGMAGGPHLTHLADASGKERCFKARRIASCDPGPGYNYQGSSARSGPSCFGPDFSFTA